MPIVIPSDLPAYKTLMEENIFVMNSERAFHQDIRPLKIIIFNLMPNKIETETHLLRLLGNTPIQVEITLLKTATYNPKNTSEKHLGSFYKTFENVKNHSFDGMIITGAPVEQLPFEEVLYWNEMKEIMEFSKKNVTSTLHICWGAQAGLYYHYGIKKYRMNKKLFGIFEHKVITEGSELLRGFDDIFYAPHSRYTTIKKKDILKVKELEIIVESEEAGVHIIVSKDKRSIFVSGHPEYDRDTIANEYFRDLKKGIEIDLPKNYFVNDMPNKEPKLTWKAHASLMFSNWLNYCVYQETPYSLE